LQLKRNVKVLGDEVLNSISHRTELRPGFALESYATSAFAQPSCQNYKIIKTPFLENLPFYICNLIYHHLYILSLAMKEALNVLDYFALPEFNSISNIKTRLTFM